MTGFLIAWCIESKPSRTALAVIFQASPAPPFLLGIGVAYNERSE